MELTPQLARDLLTGAAPLNKLIELSDEQIRHMAYLGHEMWRQGRREEAERIFRGLIALDEKISYGHAGMGLVAMELGDLAAAMQHLEKAVALEPSDPTIAGNLGEVLLRQGQIEGAVTALQRASELGSKRATAILLALSEAKS